MSFWGFFFPSISPAWWRRFLAVFLWRRTARIARDTRQLLAQIISMTAELSTAALSSAFHSMEFPFRSTLVLDVAYPTCMASHRQQLRHADPIALVPVSRRPQVLGPPPYPHHHRHYHRHSAVKCLFRLSICQLAAASIGTWRRDPNRPTNPVSWRNSSVIGDLHVGISYPPSSNRNCFHIFVMHSVFKFTADWLFGFYCLIDI